MAEHDADLSEDKAATRRRQTEINAPRMVERGAAESFLHFQSQVGNGVVARLLAQRADDDEEVQAQHETVGLAGGAVGPDTTGRIEGQRGGGAALDDGTRTSMETAFGASFRDVRVHTNDDADLLNRRLTSRAFTTGSDIFLRRDASPGDARLLAHELTHVVQQRSMSGGGGGMHVGAAGDGYERHAEAVADAVTTAPTGGPVSPVAQRADDEEEVQATHDQTQRAEDEEEEQVQATHDVTQRAEDEEEEPG
jgi:hypothetical protein